MEITSKKMKSFKLFIKSIIIMKFRVPQLTKNKIDEFFKKYADKSKSENGRVPSL